MIAVTVSGTDSGLPRGRGRCPAGTEGGSKDKRFTLAFPPQTLSPAGLKPSSPARGGARRASQECVA
jgi:hypothetical protein